MNGLLLIDKRINVTSRSVDNKIQRLFHTRKVGHLGTLDPFASGLLIIAVNGGCKALPYINDSFKTYEATLCLGKKTSSGDLTGEVIEEKEVGDIDEKDILKVFESFIGESKQIPPMTSALHHEGKRLYDLSRKGIEVDRKPRKIQIKSLKLVSFSENCIKFEVRCSRGTYVRTLGEDIAIKLNTVGHLVELRRTKIGNIDISKAIDIEDLKEEDLLDSSKLISLPKVIIDENNPLVKDIKDGKNISLENENDTILICYKNSKNNETNSLAVYNRKNGDLYFPLRGLWS